MTNKPSDMELRNEISAILLKWDMPTRQVAINEILDLFFDRKLKDARFYKHFYTQKIKEAVSQERKEVLTTPDLPEDSVHEPTSESPSPSKGLKAMTTKQTIEEKVRDIVRKVTTIVPLPKSEVRQDLLDLLAMRDRESRLDEINELVVAQGSYPEDRQYGHGAFHHVPVGEVKHRISKLEEKG